MLVSREIFTDIIFMLMSVLLVGQGVGGLDPEDAPELDEIDLCHV